MLPHINQLAGKLELNGFFEGDSVITMTAQGFRYVVQEFLRQAPMDVQWYLETNPDVQDAINSGSIASGAEHFIQFGYFEGRCFCPEGFDEDFYLRANPDIATAIANGQFTDARQHFAKFGYAEGRAFSVVDDAQELGLGVQPEQNGHAHYFGGSS